MQFVSRPRRKCLAQSLLEILEPRLMLDTNSLTLSTVGPGTVYDGHDAFITVRLGTTSSDGNFDYVAAQFTSTNPHISVTASPTSFNFTTPPVTVGVSWGMQHFSTGDRIWSLYRPAGDYTSYYVVKVHTDGDASLINQSIPITLQAETYDLIGSASHVYATGTYSFTVISPDVPPAVPTFTSRLDAIPGLNTWQENMVNAGRLQYDPKGNDNSLSDTPSGPRFYPNPSDPTNFYLVNNNNSETSHYSAWYYDGQRIAYELQDYTGSNAWLAGGDAAELNFRDHYVNYAGISKQGYRAFTKGLEMDYFRTGDTASKAAMEYVATALPYSASGGTNSPYLGRETAYALESFISLYHVDGIAGKMNQSLDLLLNTMDEWFISKNIANWGNPNDGSSPNTPYIQPHFVALVSEALITYYQEVSPDPAIADAVRHAADWMWDEMYVSDTQSMPYQRHDPYNSATRPTTGGSPWLNDLIAPAYSWLYHIYGDTPQDYRTHGDLLFQGSVNSNINSADACGYSKSGNGKIFNENFRWSIDYTQWRWDNAWTGDVTGPAINSITSAVTTVAQAGYKDWLYDANGISIGYDRVHRSPALVVNYTTDEPSKTEIQFGQVDANGLVQYTNFARPADQDILTLNHSITISGLTAGSEYHYRIKATDSSGNISYSTDRRVLAASSDGVGPTILNPVFSAFLSYREYITWDTNEDASIVQEVRPVGGDIIHTYAMDFAGRSVAEECYQGNAMNLTSGTSYEMRLTATDIAGNVTQSPWLRVRYAADTTAPAAVINSPASLSNLSGIASISATVSDNVGVFATEFKVDADVLGQVLGDGTISLPIDTTSLTYGGHTLTVTARDADLTSSVPNSTAVTRTINVVPSLSLVTLDASANRQTNDPGIFRLYRQNVNGAVTVNYTTSGNAVNGSDYNTLSGSVSFAVGEAYKDIAITPAGGSGATQTATLTLTSSSAYNIDAASATVTIIGSGLAGDANGDGTVNFKDYIVLEGNFGKTNATWAMGDFDADGTVNFKDYIILEGNFGKSAAAPAPAAQMTSATLSSVVGPVALASTESGVLGLSAQRTALRTVTWAKPQKWQFPPAKGLADAAMIDVLAAIL